MDLKIPSSEENCAIYVFFVSNEITCRYVRFFGIDNVNFLVAKGKRKK